MLPGPRRAGWDVRVIRKSNDNLSYAVGFRPSCCSTSAIEHSEVADAKLPDRWLMLRRRHDVLKTFPVTCFRRRLLNQRPLDCVDDETSIIRPEILQLFRGELVNEDFVCHLGRLRHFDRRDVSSSRNEAFICSGSFDREGDALRRQVRQRGLRDRYFSCRPALERESAGEESQGATLRLEIREVNDDDSRILLPRAASSNRGP